MNREALQQAMDNLSIKMVYLHTSEAKIYNDFDPLIPNQELIGQFNIDTKSCVKKELQEENGIKHNFLVYQTEARMRYLKGAIPKELKEDQECGEELDKLVVAEIVALFTAEYAIKCDKELPKDAVFEFGRINVPHQIWPYWREYCHSTCARMSLPVSILPMLAINKATENDS